MHVDLKRRGQCGLLDVPSLAHVLGNQSSQEIFIKFHAVDGHPLDDSCISVVVGDEFEIVGHGFASKSHIYKASARMLQMGLNLMRTRQLCRSRVPLMSLAKAFTQLVGGNFNLCIQLTCFHCLFDQLQCGHQLISAADFD